MSSARCRPLAGPSSLPSMASKRPNAAGSLRSASANRWSSSFETKGEVRVDIVALLRKLFISWLCDHPNKCCIEQLTLFPVRVKLNKHARNRDATYERSDFGRAGCELMLWSGICNVWFQRLAPCSGLSAVGPSKPTLGLLTTL